MDGFREANGRFRLGGSQPREIVARRAATVTGRRRTPHATLTCRVCQQVFEVEPHRKLTAKYCSRACRIKGAPESISVAKTTGIPRLSTQGYWFLFLPYHQRANKQGYVKLADVIFEKYHRQLRPNEIVHHRDGCKTNDHPSNLEAMDNTEHSRMHLARMLLP